MTSFALRAPKDIMLDKTLKENFLPISVALTRVYLR